MNTINSLTERIEITQNFMSSAVLDLLAHNQLQNQLVIMQALLQSLQNQEEIMKRLNEQTEEIKKWKPV